MTYDTRMNVKYSFINFSQCMFLVSFFTNVCSLKTYQVRRVNASAYLVTSLPYFDDVNFNKNDFKPLDIRPTPSKNAPTVHLTSKEYRNTNSKRKTTAKEHSSTVANAFHLRSIHSKAEAISKNKIPPKDIIKARDDYFRKFYPTTTRPLLTKNHATEKVHFITQLNADKMKESDVVAYNLEMARTLAMLLVNKGHEILKKRSRTKRLLKRYYKHNKRQVCS